MKLDKLKIFLNFLNPFFFFEIFNKIRNKFINFDGNIHANINLKWLDDKSIDMDLFLQEINHGLYKEAKTLCVEINNRAKVKLSQIPYKLGGGASLELLYFICRINKPKIILETGVAAGFSSSSILHAIRKNKEGKLYSSDFPYMKIPDPKKFIGVIVEDIDRPNWNLLLDGDRKNIPLILNKLNNIDVVHYDSDKSFRGRQFFMNIIQDKINENSVIIMDDIQNNSFFYEYVTKEKKSLSYKIFKYQNKYIGMIGNINTE